MQNPSSKSAHASAVVSVSGWSALVSHKMILMPTNIYVTFPVMNYRILQNASAHQAMFIHLYFFRRNLKPVGMVVE